MTKHTTRIGLMWLAAVACCWNVAVDAADPSSDERPGRVPAGEKYRVVFSTYLGGAKWDHARDVVADAEGNTYVVGGTGSSKADGFPVSDGAYQVLRGPDGDQPGTHKPPSDVFAASYSPDGKLRWATFIGGPNYDRAYSGKLAPDGSLILGGRSGRGFPTTAGVFQPRWQGDPVLMEALYGPQNAFVCKLSGDGQKLIWSTHVGTDLCRGCVVDDVGDVYVAIGRPGSPTVPDPDWFRQAFANAFQKKPKGGVRDIAVVKIKGDGSKVLWATWLSGSGEDGGRVCVRVDAAHNVYVGMYTNSPDMPVTGCYDDQLHGDFDAYYAKISPDGSRLLYGTYVGGSKFDMGNETNCLFVDQEGSAYATILTDSPDFPLTKDKGTYDNGLRSPGTHAAAIKLSPEGHLLYSCLVGSSGGEKVEGMTVDRQGCVIFGGRTNAADYPTTPGALQRTHSGKGDDAFLTRLSADFRTLTYSTFIGGEGDQFLRGFYADPQGRIYAVGSATGGWPTVNASQDTYAGTNDGRWANGDIVVIKLEPGSP